MQAAALVGRFHAYSQGIVSDTLNLRFEQFGKIVAPIPPRTEQRKIAAILSSVDDAIAATRKVIEQTKLVKQGVLQTLMSRGIGHIRFKKTRGGEIPKDWEVVRLSRLMDGGIRNGYSPNCPETPTGRWVLSLGALTPEGLRSRSGSPLQQRTLK